MKGICAKPEWADNEPCPLDTGELEECDGCSWFKEMEESE